MELTSVFGEGSWEHLQPLVGERGLVLVPIDRSTISLVWSDRGYPAGGAYRDYHRLTTFHHNPWNNAGDAYDHDAALERARADAADFVTRVRARLRDGAAAAPGPLPGGGLVVCALDTELLGHWWYEGVSWLAAVVEEAARQGLELVRLDEAVACGRAAAAARGGGRGVAARQLGRRRGPLDVVLAGGGGARLRGPRGRARGARGRTRGVGLGAARAARRCRPATGPS